MQRIPEPELMLDGDQARAYADADFTEPHEHCVELLLTRHPGLPDEGVALDLGCGPGDVSLRFLVRRPGWQADGIDGSPAMLAEGRRLREAAGLGRRLQLLAGWLPFASPTRGAYDLVFTNSLLHHLQDPQVLWQWLRRWMDPGTPFFLMDLLRPDSQAAARELVSRYAGEEPEVLQRDFFHSLCAAFTMEEVEQQLTTAGLEELRLEEVSDRHLVVHGQL